MGVNRFLLLLRFLQFDDMNSVQKGETPASWHQSSNCSSCLPGLSKILHHVTVRNAVSIPHVMCHVPHGTGPFKVYIPIKPAKYGMKIWIFADSTTFYCGNAQMYQCKIDGVAETGQGPRVVRDLTADISCHVMRTLTFTGRAKTSLRTVFSPTTTWHCSCWEIA